MSAHTLGQAFESLRDIERRWAPRARSVSLLAELELSEEEIDGALLLLGRYWRRINSPSLASDVIPSRWPATFAASLAGAGSIYYESGLWPYLQQPTGLVFDPNLSARWGQLFEQSLERLGLTRFPELDDEPHMRYLARILLHAGVPLFSLGDLLDQIDAAERRLGTSDASSLLVDLVERAETGRLYGADRAVGRFLRFGRDYAVDFIERLQELISSLASGQGVARVQLPQRIVDHVAGLVEARPQRRRPAARTSRRQPRRPWIAFDPYGLGVHAVLPGDDDTEASGRWSVRFDAEAVEVPASAGTQGQLTEVPLPSTLQTFEAERDGHRSAIRVLRPEDPLLMFDGDGRHIEEIRRPDRDLIWVLTPRTGGQDVAFEGSPPPRVLEVLDHVPRWPGWSARRIDLDGVEWFARAGGRKRSTSSVMRARLSGLDPVPGVEDPHGAIALRSWPHIVLPGDAASPTDWAVSLFENGTETARHEITVAERVDLSLADIAPAAPVARAEVRVRGPLGSGLRQEMVVVQGLDIMCDPPFRRLVEGGVAPCRVRLSTQHGWSRTIYLERSDRVARVHIDSGDGRTAELDVAPPAMAVRYVAGTAAGSWRPHELRLSTEDLLEAPGTLFVRVPAHVRATLRLTSGGHDLQRVESGGRTGTGVAAFDLRRVTDTCRASHACALSVDVGDRSHRVGAVQPARLAEAVDLDPGRGVFIFRDLAHVAYLRAGIYRALAPLAEPVTFDVPPAATSAVVPVELLGTGQLRMLLRIDDPWDPRDWPTFPRLGRNVFDLDQPSPTSLHDLLDIGPVAPLLSGLATTIRDGTPLDELLDLYPLLDRLPLTRRYAVRQVLTDAFRTRADRTLEAAARSRSAIRDLATTLAGSGALELRYASVGEDDAVERLWSRWPPLGVIGAGYALAAAGARGEGMRALAAQRVGEPIQSLLRGEGHPALSRPRFDERPLIELGRQQLDLVFREAAIGPSRLLEDNAQAIAGRDLLFAIQRMDAGVSVLLENPDVVVREIIQHFIVPAHLQVVEDAVRTRLCGDGWQAIPAMALALAAAVRIEARLPQREKRMNAFWRRRLAVLASLVPGLVAADLVMVEALIIGGPDD
jgi:hypothetical protein